MTSRMMIPDDQDPIAIIGTACRFSGQVSSLPTLRNMISNVKTGHCKVPSSRWDADLLHHPDPDRKGTVGTRQCHFDAPFFSTTAKEASAMDPMKRLLLEVSYESIENAGIQMESLVNSDTACSVGCMTNDYEILSAHDMQDMGYSAATGISKAMTANRVSWFFGLRGPSLTLDTACSSSLHALHLACQSLRLGGTSQALVACVNMMLHPNCMEQFSAIHMLSPEGISHSFDDRANGYGRGEGIGCIVVKRLSDALRDGDTIRAVIRGSGANSDGKTPSLTQPSSEAQANLIKRTYASAGLSLSSTEYFECHGTGTPVGDPIELRALASTIGGARAAAGLGPLYIGSVKPNIGHTGGCSALAGIFKAILCLEKGILIILDDVYHYLNERNLSGNHKTTVHDDDRSSESGISMGPSTPMSSVSSSSVLGSGSAAPAYRLFAFSARDQAGTQRMAKEYERTLGSAKFKNMSGTELDDLAYTLAVRRTAHDYRSVIAASSVDELCAKLGRPNAMEELNKTTEEMSQILLPEFSQTLCSVLQVALVDLVRHWNVKPRATIGHSSGEIAAAGSASLSRQAAQHHLNKRSDIDDDKSASDLLWTRQTQDYDAICQDGTAADVDIDDFYEHLESKGMEYGDLFRNVVSLTSVPGKLAVHGSIVIPDTASVMPGNFEYPHAIHPATMDAIFHLLLATVSDGAVTEEAAVPYHLNSMFVAAQQPKGAGAVFKGYSSLAGKSHGGRQVIGDLVVSDEVWSAPKIQVKGFALRQVTFNNESGSNSADGEAWEKNAPS
ncbi:hypothetical protein ARSEF4850_001893 [Beauveria asiatica]